MFADEGWLPTACLRYFNVFGPRQDPKSQYAAAVPIFIDRALRREPITIYGDGEQTRDFIFVKDIAEALEATWREYYRHGELDKALVDFKEAATMLPASAEPLVFQGFCYDKMGQQSKAEAG